MNPRVVGATFAVALVATSLAWWSSSRNATPVAKFGNLDGYLIDPATLSEKDHWEEGHAWEMFDWWYGQRAYPQKFIPKSGFYDAWEYERQNLSVDASQLGRSATMWTSMGPDNVGGRMLSLAIDPVDPSRLWSGAASGGLWLSTTAGLGASAWTRVETGFPSLSVSSIVIDQSNSDHMWIGTGEISRYERPLIGTPGARSSYGMGVLRTTDGGASWQTTGLTWTFDQSRAVLAMRQHPSNAATLYAATSEGLYKTTDSGGSWANVHPLLMAMDVVMDPTNGDVVYVSHGQLGVPAAPDAGIYKSTNGGSSWTQLGGGLPTTDFGRTPLTISSNGAVIYAGVSDASTRQITGLYRSTDAGSSWQLRSSLSYAGSQAWYDNTISVSPNDDDLLICAGLDVARSANGGPDLAKVAFWYLGYDGNVPAGGPEGPSDYVHADQHWIEWDPVDPDLVYVACDGGVFRSTNAGVDWEGINGGLQTTQFYAGFANGYSTTDLALGGLQDNGTLLYEGSNSWNKTFGGDGGWCAIDPNNEDIMYEEYVRANMHKTTNGGNSWFEILPQSAANFIAPFVLCESSSNVLYAGLEAVYKTTNGGSSWSYPDGNSSWNGTPVATIGVSREDEDYVIAGTGDSGAAPIMEVRWSTNGGSSWSTVAGGQLPDRYPTDFTYDSLDKTRVWATFSGYGTGHVFLSTDAGATWADRSGNLPDIPHQSIAADPIDQNWVYVGTDLGVYRSTDAGTSWTTYDVGMPTAMITDLVIMVNERRMRAATFGNGVYEIDLPEPATDVAIGAGTSGSAIELSAGRPNPFRGATTLSFSLTQEADVELAVYDAAGRLVRDLVAGARPAGRSEVVWDARDSQGREVAPGVYFVRLGALGAAETAKLTVLR